MRDIMSEQLTTLINKGYDALKNKQTQQTLMTWQQAYQKLKQELKNEKISFLQLGNYFGFQQQTGNWLKQIAETYLKNDLYDDTILYCQDIIDTFKEDKYLDDFQINIGQALFLKGEKDKAHEHFQTLLKKYPNDLDIIYHYLLCLKNGDIRLAKEIIIKYVPLSLEYNVQSEPLFQLSKEILTELQETELIKKYSKVNKIQNDFGKRKPVTKKVTVGRNDPCPCGSGKKYKKCCGR